jgi:regulator of protease activity HflC (stomatin/prohibitin superfamily)
MNTLNAIETTVGHLNKGNPKLMEAITTRLTQVTVSDLEDANLVFGAKDNSGGTPIVITPRRTSKANILALMIGCAMAFVGIFLSQIPGIKEVIGAIIFSGFGLVTYWPTMLIFLFIGIYPLMVLQIPSGVFALMTKYGRYIGVYEAGRHFLPPWYKVAYMVTRQSTAYNAPVKNCPTADNVMVKVDLLLVFHIEDPEKFVYKLGAEKFGDLLASSAEEGIRSLVRGTTHNKAYELRGQGASEMISSLNDNFSHFGVLFTTATITNVVLPGELADALENQTVFDAKKQEQEKHQELELKVLNDREALARQELNKKNERLSADEEAKKERQIIMKETAEIEYLKKKRLAEIQAEQNANVLAIEAKGEHEASILKAQALLKRAEAEEQAASRMQPIRELELEKMRIESLKAVAENGKIVISGQNGDNLIAQILASTQAHQNLSTTFSLKEVAEKYYAN